MECKKSITHTPGIRVHKLMKEFKPLSFQEPIFDALQTGDLKFPELLLWNDEGLQFFDKFAQTPTYYLNSKEIEILNRNADEIAACLLPNSSLIELGCG